LFYLDFSSSYAETLQDKLSKSLANQFKPESILGNEMLEQNKLVVFTSTGKTEKKLTDDYNKPIKSAMAMRDINLTEFDTNKIDKQTVNQELEKTNSKLEKSR